MAELTPKATGGGNVELSVPLTKQHPCVQDNLSHTHDLIWSTNVGRSLQNLRSEHTAQWCSWHLTCPLTPFLCTGLPVHCQSDSSRLESHWGWPPPYMQQLLNLEAEIIGYWYCSILFKGMRWSPASGAEEDMAFLAARIKTLLLFPLRVDPDLVCCCMPLILVFRRQR